MFTLSGQAKADELDVFNLLVGANLQHDTNLFRLADGLQPATANGRTDRSDQIASATLGLQLNKPYALQRFIVDASLTRYRYSNYGYLNNSARDLNADWKWQITPRISGNFIYNYSRVLNSFADFQTVGVVNTRTNFTRRFDMDAWVGGGWHPGIAVYQTEQRNDQPTSDADDTDIRSIEPVLRYEFQSGSSASFYWRDANGRYLNHVLDSLALIDTGFEERELGLRTVWSVTGKSTLNLNVGHLNRTNDHFSARNFSGMVGDLRYVWMPTTKVTVSAGVIRALVSNQALDSSYVLNKTYSLAPTWKVTEKISLNGRFENTRSDYQGAVLANGVLRADNTRLRTVSMEWAALRNVRVGLSYQAANRDSNLPGLQYTDQLTNLSARLAF